jgi:hypothetical protein
MGGYDFPGQIAASDGSEGNGAMGEVSIVLGNSAATGSIRVGRTEEGTDGLARGADFLGPIGESGHLVDGYWTSAYEN